MQRHLKERAARRLAGSNAPHPVDAGVGANLIGKQVGIVEEALDLLDTGQDLDQSRVVIPERRRDRPAAALAIFFKLSIGERRAGPGADVQPRQRADPVNPAGITPR